VQATEAAYASAGKVRDAATEWLSYSGDKVSSKYSPLAQISGGNFNRLKTQAVKRFRQLSELPVPHPNELT